MGRHGKANASFDCSQEGDANANAVFDFEADKKLSIVVTKASGQQERFEVSAGMQACELKNKIEETEGIPAETQRLLFGDLLFEVGSLAEMRVQDNDVFTLVVVPLMKLFVGVKHQCAGGFNFPARLIEVGMHAKLSDLTAKACRRPRSDFLVADFIVQKGGQTWSRSADGKKSLSDIGICNDDEIDVLITYDFGASAYADEVDLLVTG